MTQKVHVSWVIHSEDNPSKFVCGETKHPGMQFVLGHRFGAAVKHIPVEQLCHVCIVAVVVQISLALRTDTNGTLVSEVVDGSSPNKWHTFQNGKQL